MISRRSFLETTLAGSTGLAIAGSEAVVARLRTAAAPVVERRAVVFQHPNDDPYDLTNRHGFNHATSVTRLADGRLLAAWFSGPFEASVHQVILSSASSDEGRTWSPVQVLQDTPRQSDFDPAFISDGQRTWFFYSCGRWNRYPFVPQEKSNVGVDSFKVYSRVTDDAGRTWSAPKLVLEKAGMGCRSNGLRLSTGELVLPLHGFISGVAALLKSSDRGETWRRVGNVTTATVAHEPSVAEVAPGELLMVLRTNDGHLWTTRSTDRGETWQPTEKSALVAARSSHSLLALLDGRLVLTHNESKPPLRTPLTLRVSTDRGATWGPPLELASVEPPKPEDDVWNRQVSYPSAVELPGGQVLAVWGSIVLGELRQYGDIHAAVVKVSAD